MLEELPQPRPIQRGEKVADISVEYPVHLSLRDPNRQRIQRIMRSAPRPEPVRETEKVLLVYGVQHLSHRSLDDLVLQGGDAQRALPPVRLWYVHPTRRAGPVCTTIHTTEPAI